MCDDVKRMFTTNERVCSHEDSRPVELVGVAEVDLQTRLRHIVSPLRESSLEYESDLVSETMDQMNNFGL